MSARRTVKPISLLLAFAFVGCTSFQTEWRKAGNTHSRDLFDGQWTGRWTSARHKNSGGSLQCVLTKLDERHYRGRFRAGWLSFHATYTAAFEAERRGRALQFTGDRDLGPLAGGNYHFEGRATAEHFRATYDSSYDRGVFEMSRPEGQTADR